MSDSLQSTLVFLWGLSAVCGGAFLCFAFWFNEVSAVTACWKWKNSLRANLWIGHLTILSVIVLLSFINHALSFLPWWVAVVVSIIIGIYLANWLYTHPSQWRYMKAEATVPPPPY